MRAEDFKTSNIICQLRNIYFKFFFLLICFFIYLTYSFINKLFFVKINVICLCFLKISYTSQQLIVIIYLLLFSLIFINEMLFSLLLLLLFYKCFTARLTSQTYSCDILSIPYGNFCTMQKNSK